jgi:hypothetical protein
MIGGMVISRLAVTLVLLTGGALLGPPLAMIQETVYAADNGSSGQVSGNQNAVDCTSTGGSGAPCDSVGGQVEYQPMLRFRAEDSAKKDADGGYVGRDASGGATIPGNLTIGTLTGPNSIQLVYLPDPSVFLESLVIGDGGKQLTTSGPNPVDPLPFEANGSYNGIYNTFVGIKAGVANTSGNWNTFVGQQAGTTNTIGDQNTFVGGVAGQSNTTGYHNTFVGVGAGQANVAGNYNTYVGTDTALFAPGGTNNTFVGSMSGSYNNADNNVFLGVNAGTATSTGANNTFLGTFAANLNTTGYDNQCLGYATCLTLTSGFQNTAVGREAGSGLTTGALNTFVGYIATTTKGDVTNSIAIGNGASVSGDNRAVIGNGSVTDVYLGSETSAANLRANYLYSAGKLFGLNDGTYNKVYHSSGGIAFAAGGAGDPVNYYQSDTHRFTTADGVTAQLTISSSGAALGAGRFSQALYTPASSSASCTAGQFADDANYHYVCTATNTWKRVALSAF